MVVAFMSFSRHIFFDKDATNHKYIENVRKENVSIKIGPSMTSWGKKTSLNIYDKIRQLRDINIKN